MVYEGEFEAVEPSGSGGGSVKKEEGTSTPPPLVASEPDAIWIKAEKIEAYSPSPSPQPPTEDEPYTAAEADEPYAPPSSEDRPGEHESTADNVRDPYDGMRFECGGCMLSFSVKDELLRHQREQGGACSKSRTLFRCNSCGKLFTKRYAAQSHLLVHVSDRPHACATCGQKFKHKSTAQKHCTKTKNSYPCAECGKSYQSLCSLEMHNRIHTGVKPYQCAVCERKFTHKYNMMRHVETQHAKQKKLECDICGRKFPIESRLRYHMRVHWTDKKPFKCEHCHKSYSHKQNIERHYKKKHPSVEYIAPATDAELAQKAWDASSQKESMIIPDIEGPEVFEKDDVVNVIVQPELVTVMSNSDSDSEGSGSDDGDGNDSVEVK